MSLILDALKKLDREKSALRNRTPNIAVEILKPDLPRPQKRIQRYFVAVSLTAVAAATLTYAVLEEFGFLAKSSLPTATTAPAPTQQALLSPPPLESSSPWKSSAPEPKESLFPSHPAATVPPELGSPSKPLSPAPVKAPASSQRVTSAPPKPDLLSRSSAPALLKPSAPSQQVEKTPLPPEPVRGVARETGGVPSKAQDAGESKMIRPPGGKDRPTPQVRLQERAAAPVSPMKPAEKSPAESATTPTLKITGIVWHEDPSLRRAVVNGLFANEGSTIEGVRVLEIHPTHVRFSHQNRIFEVSIFK